MTVMAALVLTVVHPRPPSPYPILNADRRLQVHLSLHYQGTVGDLLATVARKAGVQICCQGDYMSRRVVEEVADQEVREVLTQVAAQGSGFWVKRAGVYWLIGSDFQSLTPFFAGGVSQARAIDLMRQFIDSLSPVEWTRLRSGEKLSTAEMTGPQQNWFVSAWNQEFGLHTNRYLASQWFSKAGGLITYAAADDTLTLWFPRIDEKGQIEPKPSPFLRVPVHQ